MHSSGDTGRSRYRIPSGKRDFYRSHRTHGGKRKRPDRCPASGKLSLGSRLFAAVAAAITSIAAAATTTTAAIAAVATATTAASTTKAATRATPEAAATATTTATEAAAFTAAAKTAGARRALFARTGDVHRQGATFHLEAVEFFDRFLGVLGAAHRDEGKAAGAAGELVEDNLDDADGASLTKQSLKVLRSASEG
jgi:hypothetical protein